MKKNQTAIRIPMPLRYLMNLVLIAALWLVLYVLIQNGTILMQGAGQELLENEEVKAAYLGSAKKK